MELFVINLLGVVLGSVVTNLIWHRKIIGSIDISNGTDTSFLNMHIPDPKKLENKTFVVFRMDSR